MNNFILVLAILGSSLTACNERRRPVAEARPAPAFSGPVLGSDGRCQGQPPGEAAAIQPGIGECELVRLKGKQPTDVLVGESGKGHREVQVLYAEPGGREIYLFVNNRLDRVVK